MDTARRRDLLWGVLVPGFVLGPFVGLGLLAVALARPDFGDATVSTLVAAMLLAGVYGLVLRAAIVAEPGTFATRPARRTLACLVLALGCVALLLAIAAQLPGVRWALGPDGHPGALLLQVPGLAVLLGPLLVGSKYLRALLRRGSDT